MARAFEFATITRAILSSLRGSVSTWESLPPLRAVEIIQLPSRDGQPVICLRDRLDPEVQPLLLGREGLLLASLLDGQRTLGAVRAAFALRTGLLLPTEQIERFVAQLDQAHLLDTPAYRARLDRQRNEFLARSMRPAAHAGGAYPGEPAALRRFLDNLYLHPDGPGGPPR